MVSRADLDNSRDSIVMTKPMYQPPVLVELNAGETADGLITGAPENNETYS